MSCFFDTSVPVAAFWEQHSNHEASFRRFAATTSERGTRAAHSVAELYSVMTRLPVRPLIPPEIALLFVGEIRSRLDLIALEPWEYYETIERAASQGLSGGRIYDALLLRCAEKVDASTVYTWNLGHFRDIAPQFASRIVTP